MTADLEKAKSNPRAQQILLAIFVGYLSLGTIFYHIVEKWNWLNSLYFTVITLSTVGYGDYSPKTSAGKIFTIFYVFIGIGIFVYTANHFLKSRIDHRVESAQNKQQDK